MTSVLRTSGPLRTLWMGCRPERAHAVTASPRLSSPGPTGTCLRGAGLGLPLSGSALRTALPGPLLSPLLGLSAVPW